MPVSDRLVIRRVRADDWRAIQSIWSGVDQTEYAQYDIPRDTRDDAMQQRIGKWADFASSEAHLFLAVCLEALVIGYVSLHQRAFGYELGYCFHPDYHGKGYARESLSVILHDLKKRGPFRIEAGTALQNLPSVRLLTHLGFEIVRTEQVSFYKDAAGNDIFFEGGVFALQL